MRRCALGKRFFWRRRRSGLDSREKGGRPGRLPFFIAVAGHGRYGWRSTDDNVNVVTSSFSASKRNRKRRRTGDDHDDHMPLEMPMDGWKPLATIARDVGVPEPSARRYANAFAEFVRSRKIGKATLYAPELGELLRIAAAGFANGQRRDEVAADLAKRFGRVFDVPGGDEPATTPTVAPGQVGLAALLPLAERFVTVLERGVAALEALAANRPVQAFKGDGQGNVHSESQTSFLGPPTRSVPAKSRTEIVQEVLRHHADGLGAAATATAMRRLGWPTLSGRGTWAKGSVRRILKNEVDHGE